MSSKSFDRTLKGIVEAADRFGKVKADHERWMEINKMTFTAKGECGENHTLAQRLACVKCNDHESLKYRLSKVSFWAWSKGYSVDAIELLEKAMEYQNDIWNDAIEEAASSLCKSDIYNGKPYAEIIRKLKK